MNLRVRHLNINYSIQIKVIAEWNSSLLLSYFLTMKWYLDIFLLFKKNNKMGFVVGYICECKIYKLFCFNL